MSHMLIVGTTWWQVDSRISFTIFNVIVKSKNYKGYIFQSYSFYNITNRNRCAKTYAIKVNSPVVESCTPINHLDFLLCHDSLIMLIGLFCCLGSSYLILGRGGGCIRNSEKSNSPPLMHLKKIQPPHGLIFYIYPNSIVFFNEDSLFITFIKILPVRA